MADYKEHWDRLGFDPLECENFISKNMKFLNIIVPLFEYTKYYSTDAVVTGIKDLVIEWKEQRNNDIPLYVHINSANNEIGSEYWLYTIVKDTLPAHKIINQALLNQCTNNEIEILSLDDWCLSGNNMLGVTEDLLYDSKYKSKIYYSFIFFLVGTHCTSILTSVLKKYYTNVIPTFFYKHKIEPFNPHLKETENNKKLLEEFTKTFSPDTESLIGYPVIFEYKVANQFGSYPEIYKKCRSFKKPYKSKEV